MTRTTSLYEPVLAEMGQVEETLASLARVDTPWLRDMLAAVLFTGGKRMRPAVSLLAGKFGEFRSELSVPLATSLELLHTASLVHDDVVDGAGTRRGRPTAGKLFDNHGAVILGDYIFAQAAALVARTGHAEVVRLFAETMIMMSMAQLAEDRAAFTYDQTVDDYLRRIRGKTASLFAIAAQGGALVSGASHEEALALRSYGENLGMAFQIVDDILDFSGDEREMGKPVGSDLIQGTLTLPSLLLIERHPDDNPVRRLFQDDGDSELLREAIDTVCRSDILCRAQATAKGFGDAARAALTTLPSTRERESLDEIAVYVLERRA
jgi:geranylgeranyl pyrophosphate synthase